MIRFNYPYFSGKELEYIQDAVNRGKISGDGEYSKKCESFFKEKFKFDKALLTTSCTDALEMSSLLCDIKEGDEVIIPSYTFVSSANPFVMRGAEIIFADSRSDHPGIDESSIESLITEKTKAIVPIHYGGVACDMDILLELSQRNNIYIIEDAAQAINSFYKGKPLGGIGDLGTFSFHETKNITSGEGGLLAVNNPDFISRSEILREKGTNRSAFFRGEIDKYGWVDIGSSYLPSDMIAAFLYAQLENLESIQNKRVSLWKQYYGNLVSYNFGNTVTLPFVPEYATNNAHMFYIVLQSLEHRTSLIDFLKKNGISSVFHYQSLHKSEFYKNRHKGPELPNSDRYTDTLLRLPMHCYLSAADVDFICEKIKQWYDKESNRI